MTNGDSVAEQLEALAETSDALHQAMLHRDTEAIINLSARQETIVSQLSPNPASGHPETSGTEKDRIRNLARRIRRVQQSNQAMAHTVLQMIEQAFNQACAGIIRSNGLYGSAGNIQRRIIPVLVEQKG